MSAAAFSIDIAPFRQVHAGARHRLYRGTREGRRILAKLAAAGTPSGAAVAAMRHEYELLHGLDLVGVVHVLDLASTGEGLALLMDDVGSASLADLLRAGPLPVIAWLDVAV